MQDYDPRARGSPYQLEIIRCSRGTARSPCKRSMFSRSSQTREINGYAVKFDTRARLSDLNGRLLLHEIEERAAGRVTRANLSNFAPS